ncbi:MAG: enoyl-CoA hydratase [Chloroflexi bacterium]|nr:MAG: enoyl-CoA hydratase [Chloroflexota bacterium]
MAAAGMGTDRAARTGKTTGNLAAGATGAEAAAPPDRGDLASGTRSPYTPPAVRVTDANLGSDNLSEVQLTKHVAYELKDRIAHVRLTRPEARNALSPEQIDGLLEAMEKVSADRRARVVLLSAEGPIFCAGGDLKAFASATGLEGLADGVHRALFALHRCEAPVIAAIQGGAIGYGLGLASACDVRLAAEGTRFQVGFTGIGLSPDSTTSYFLPRLLGPSRARYLMLTNTPFDAAQALAIGYVAEVHPPERLLDAAAELAARIARLPSGALRRAKRLLEVSLDNPLERQVELEVGFIAESFASDDFREGVTAFVEKRKPEFAPERQ